MRGELQSYEQTMWSETHDGGSFSFFRLRLKNSSVRYLDDHRIKIIQEKCGLWFFPNYVESDPPLGHRGHSRPKH
jgi:hypothetical protein